MESIGWGRRKVGSPVSDGRTQQRLRLSCCQSDGHAVAPRSRRTAQKMPFSTNALTGQVTATLMVAFCRRSGIEPSCAGILRATASTISELRCGQAECTKASHFPKLGRLRKAAPAPILSATYQSGGRKRPPLTLAHLKIAAKAGMCHVRHAVLAGMIFI